MLYLPRYVPSLLLFFILDVPDYLLAHFPPFEELSLALFKVNLLATHFLSVFLPLRMPRAPSLSGCSHRMKVLSLQALKNVLSALSDFW